VAAMTKRRTFANPRNELWLLLSRPTVAFLRGAIQGLEAVDFYFSGDDSRFGNEAEDAGESFVAGGFRV
jgi:hypothetical protein